MKSLPVLALSGALMTALTWARPDTPDILSSGPGHEIPSIAGLGPSNQALLTYRGRIPGPQGETEFEIHTMESHKKIAQRVASLLTQKAQDLFEYFAYTPKETLHILISDQEIANGAATVFPRNLIWLNDFPPLGVGSLAVNKNWLHSLLVHELVHIIHMDQTRGVLDVLRTIFGTVAKWGGVVPRWFSEGLATWAESHFSDHQGRLNDPRILADLYEILVFERNCHSVDCLDDPGRFPFGNLAYWAGGAFLQYLEGRKPYSLRCLVAANSARIPFFLNRSFRECLGQDVAAAFGDFKAYLKRQYLAGKRKAQDNPLLSRAQALKLPKESTISWYQGEVIHGSSLIFAEYQGLTQYLTEFNFSTNQIHRHRLKKPMAQIYAGSRPQGPISIQLFNPMAVDFDYELARFNPEDQTVEYLDLPGAYHFPHQGGWLVARYEESQWRLYHARASGERETQPWLSLPPFLEFHRPHHLQLGGESFIAFFSNFKDQPNYGLYLIRTKSKEILQLLTHSKPLTWHGRCQDKLLLSQSAPRGEYFLVDLKGSLQGEKGRSRQMSSPQFEDLSYLNLGERFSLLRAPGQDMKPMIYPQGCTQLLAELTQMSPGRVKEVPLRPLKLRQAMAQANQNQNQTNSGEKLGEQWESYPSWRHFIPRYWMLWFNTGTNTAFAQASTELSDPLGRHRLSLFGRWFFEVDEWGPEVGYNYQPFFWLNLGASYSEFFTYNTFAVRADQFKTTTAYLNFPLFFGSWSYRPELSYAWRDEFDFISFRQRELATFSQTLSFRPTFWDDFWQGMGLRSEVFRAQSEDTALGGETLGERDYWGLQSRFMLRNRFSPRWSSTLTASYGRLFKNSFFGGTLFGGGASSDFIGASFYHEFYGLPYGDIFGNVIVTGRYQGEWLLRENFSGSGTSPFFFRETSLVAGADYLNAERFFVGQDFFRNQELWSYHAGVRLDMTLFYSANVEVDFLFTYLDFSPVATSERLGNLLLLRGRLF